MRAHVGLNLVFLVPGETGGMETYARELIEALVAEAPDLRLTAFVNREAAGPATARGTSWSPRSPCPWRPATGSSGCEESSSCCRASPRSAGVDLVHSLGSTGPAWGRFRRVSTIHDLHYRTVPEAHFGFRALGMRVLVPLSARRAHRVIADSHAVRDELVSLLRLPPGEIDVVPLGFGAQAPRQAPGHGSELRRRLGVDDDEPIALSVSAKRPHKNLMALLDALALIAARAAPRARAAGLPDRARGRAARACR